LILPDWLYSALLDSSLVLTIDRAYFGLSGGIERWLYRLVRKHAGRQTRGWKFDVKHLHVKSGSTARLSDFALDLRSIAKRQALPGYRLRVERTADGNEWLSFGVRARPSLPSLTRDLLKLPRPVDKL
jgi:plasmid replication initiation protein